MKAISLSSLILLCFGIASYSQLLTKEEIRSEWLKSNMPITRDSILSRILTKEAVYEKDFVKAFNELKENNIDTLGLLQFSTTGGTKETYDHGLYLVWQSKGRYYSKYFGNKMIEEKELLERSYFIYFFKQQYSEMLGDFLMPPIYAGRRVGNTVEYDGQIVMHEKYYNVFCQLGEIFKAVEFGSSYISDEKSLFYLDNLSTFSYHWFLIAEAEMKKSLLQPVKLIN